MPGWAEGGSTRIRSGTYAPAARARQGSQTTAPAAAWDGTWSEVFPPGGHLRHTAVHDPVRGRMLVFGGWDDGPSDELWSFDLEGGTGWSRIVPAGNPPPGLYGHSAIYDPVRDRLLIFGGSSSGFPTNAVWELSLATGPSWRPIVPAGTPPIGRMNHSAIYDRTRHRMIVFGGFHPFGYRNDVWSLSLTGDGAWSEISPAGAPPAARYLHAAVFDPVRDRMLVVGGYGSGTSRQETWALALAGNAAWSLLAPGGIPHPGGVGHSAIFDPARDRMVVFGGSDGNSMFQTNRLSMLLLAGGTAWDTLGAAGPPPTPRAVHSAIYDPARDRMIVFGGAAGSTYRDDVWTLTLAGDPAWQVLSPPGGAPSGRHRASAIHDPARERMLVFGGWDGDTLRNDVWSFSLGAPAWSELTITGTPPSARYGHAAAFDPVRDRMLVFAGVDYPVGHLNDVWALSLAGHPTWEPVSAAGPAPAPRYYHTTVYDPVRDRLLVFGGYDDRNVYADLWELSLAGTPTWSPIVAAGTAPALAGHTAIYDPVRDRIVVFGGWDGTRYGPQVWILSLAGAPAWRLIPGTGTVPPGRVSHGSVHDLERDRLVVFGGYDGSNNLNDVWALALAGAPAWTELAPAGTPPSVRFGHHAIYHPAGGRMLVFGGFDGTSEFMDEIWELRWPSPVAVPPGPGAAILGAGVALLGVWPNPATRTFVVAFSLGSDEPGTLEMFDLGGRMIGSRSVLGLRRGTHRVTMTEAGRLPAGVYTIRLRQAAHVSTARGVILR